MADNKQLMIKLSAIKDELACISKILKERNDTTTDNGVLMVVLYNRYNKTPAEIVQLRQDVVKWQMFKEIFHIPHGFNNISTSLLNELGIINIVPEVQVGQELSSSITGVCDNCNNCGQYNCNLFKCSCSDSYCVDCGYNIEHKHCSKCSIFCPICLDNLPD